MERENLKYWLALSRIKGAEAPLFRDFLEGAKDIREVFEGCADRIIPEGLKVVFERIRGFSGWDEVGRELELLEKRGANLITIKDSLYPERLRGIYGAPLILYAKGAFYDASLPVMAVVGTRGASHYGLKMAEALSRDLAGAGFVIVSGLARGCDSAAHRGALSITGAKTVAVLGTGIDVIYPGENRRLYEEIAERGLLLSEFAFSTPPFKQNFPARNRIIIGMSLGVVVIEAPLRSGAMTTARLALEQGREVFALPGPADSKKSAGANKLIKDGATLAEGAEDILRYFFPEKTFLRAVTPGKGVLADKEEGLIVQLLDEGPLHIDTIVEKTRFPVQKVSSLLLGMELKGMVEQRPGKFFSYKG